MPSKDTTSMTITPKALEKVKRVKHYLSWEKNKTLTLTEVVDMVFSDKIKEIEKKDKKKED